MSARGGYAGHTARTLRHASYIERSDLTPGQRERYDEALADAYRRLGSDSPLVNSPAYRAGLAGRIVRETREQQERLREDDEALNRYEAERDGGY